MKYAGELAIVTGAASGIGRALCRELAARGAKVVATDINEAGLVETAAGQDNIDTALLDVRDAEAVRALIEERAAAHGSLGFLFNNAGVGVAGELRHLTLDQWERAIDVNLRGVIHGVHAAYPIMVKQGRGTLVNTASTAGLYGVPLVTPYTATKHAVVGLGEGLRYEAERHGVRVATLCPSAIETPILDAENPADLDEHDDIWPLNIRLFLKVASGVRPVPVEEFAREALDTLEVRDGVLPLPARARKMHRIIGWFPGLLDKGMRKAVDAVWPDEQGKAR